MTARKVCPRSGETPTAHGPRSSRDALSLSNGIQGSGLAGTPRNIGNLKAAVIGFERDLLPGAFAEQHADAQRLGLQITHALDDFRQRLSRVENIVEHQDITATQIRHAAGMYH